MASSVSNTAMDRLRESEVTSRSSSSGRHSSYHMHGKSRPCDYRSYCKTGFVEKTGITGRMLHKIMLHTKTDFQPLPGYGHKNADVMQRINAGVDCDEVYPNIFIGNSGAARNKSYLQRLEVSHILNCAEGRGQVETGEEFYKDVGISYLGLALEDDSSADLECHLRATSEFIDTALLAGGRVMVNCVMGMSRSCAVVLGFLMLRRGLGAREAVVAVRRRRNVRPNGGFLSQLAHLDNRLSRKRGIPLDYEEYVSRSCRKSGSSVHSRAHSERYHQHYSHSRTTHRPSYEHRRHSTFGKI